MPRRSLGCKQCRRRKVGCDLGKPGCLKCLQYGVHCPGYADPRDTLRFIQYISSSSQSAPVPSSSLTLGHAPSSSNPRSWLPCDPVRPRSLTGTSLAPSSPQSIPVVSRVLNDAKNDDSSSNSTSSSSGASLDGFLTTSEEEGANNLARSGIVALSTRSLHRSQWTVKFLELYGSKPQFQFLNGASQVTNTTPLFNTALEALSLAGLGTQWHNGSNKIEMPRMLLNYDRQGMQREARSSYAHALSLLAREVSRQPTIHQRKIQRLVFMSIQMLRYFEGFDNQQSNHFDGMIAHNHGATQYLRACGPSIISKPRRDGTWPEDWLLLGPLRTSACMLGIVERKAVMFADPKWRDLAKPAIKAYNTTVEASQAHEIVLSLPQMLEEADNLTPRDIDEWRALVTGLFDVRKELDAWLKEKCSQLELYDVRDCPGLSHFIGGTLFRGQSFIADAWVFRLLITCTLLRAGHVCQAVNLDMKDLQREIYVNATDLARISPSWLEDYPQRSRWYIDFPYKYFESTGLLKELKWSQTVLRVADENIPKTPPGRLYCHQRWRPWDMFTSAAAPATFKFPDRDSGGIRT